MLLLVNLHTFRSMKWIGRSAAEGCVMGTANGCALRTAGPEAMCSRCPLAYQQQETPNGSIGYYDSDACGVPSRPACEWRLGTQCQPVCTQYTQQVPELTAKGHDDQLFPLCIKVRRQARLLTYHNELMTLVLAYARVGN